MADELLVYKYNTLRALAMELAVNSGDWTPQSVEQFIRHVTQARTHMDIDDLWSIHKTKEQQNG